jgi:hypothetical protein
MKWMEHVVHMGENDKCSVLAGKNPGKKPHGTPRHKWEDDIKIDFTKELGWKGLGCIYLAQNRH